MDKQRKILVAIAASVAILFGFQLLAQAPVQNTAARPQQVSRPSSSIGSVRDELLQQSQRIPFQTGTLSGSVNLTGARIDDLTLIGYHEDANPTSPEKILLSPAGMIGAYYAEFGVVPGAAWIKVPGLQTVWAPTEAVPSLTPDHPLTLAWDNGAGLRFVRTIAIDDKYVFTIRQRIENSGSAAVELYPYGFISRTGTPPVWNTYMHHEGPIGVLDGVLVERRYSDVKKDPFWAAKSTGGWVGFTDPYFLTALIPEQTAAVQGRYVYQNPNDIDRFQVDFTKTDPLVIQPGNAGETTSHLYAGPKVVRLLDGYSAALGVPKFDLAIDFGWFWFLTKPMALLLVSLSNLLGGPGLAIIALALLAKLAFLPFANMAYRSMRQMKTFTPQIEAIRTEFADDPDERDRKLAEFHKQEKITASSGCLPLIAQAIVFFAIYKAMFVLVEFSHAPFAWVTDLTAADPSNVFTLFGLVPWDAPSFLHLGALPILLGVTIWVLQRRISGTMLRPWRRKLFLALPFIIPFTTARQMAGYLLFFAVYAIFSIVHQWWLLREESEPVGAVPENVAKGVPFSGVQPVYFLMSLAPVTVNILMVLVFWPRSGKREPAWRKQFRKGPAVAPETAPADTP